MFTSTNNGSSWTKLANFTSTQAFFAGGSPPAALQFNEKFQLQADPANAGVVYVDGESNDSLPRIYSYSPGGSSWTPINRSGASGNTDPHADSRDLAFLINGGVDTLIETDDGGVYEMENPTSASANTWNSFDGNLEATEVYSIAYDQKLHTLAVGTQDNGSPQQNSPGSATWTDGSGGDGQYQAVDATSTDAGTGSLHYALSDSFAQFLRLTYNSSGVEVGTGVQVGLASSFHGTTLSGLDTLDRNLANSGAFTLTPYVVNNVESGGPGMMLLGYNGLYEDNGTGRVAGQLAGDVITELTTETGPATSPTISLSGATLTGTFSALAYGGNFGGSAYTNVAVVGTNKGELFFRGQSGSSFTDVTGFLPDASGITSIALDPANWRHVYLIQDNRVEVTADITNPADPFTVIGFGMKDNLPAAMGNPAAPDLSSVVVVDVGGIAVPLVGGFGGVYRLAPSSSTANSASTWSRYGQGLPNVIVTSVVYNATNDVLAAGTFGRGVWTVPSASTSVGAPDTLLICGDTDVTNENDTFKLIRDQTDPSLLDVFINNNTAVPDEQVSLAPIQTIAIYGGGGNNTLIVDSSNGLINVPDGIDWNAADPCPDFTFDGESAAPGEDGFNQTILTQTAGAIAPTLATDVYSVGPEAGNGARSSPTTPATSRPFTSSKCRRPSTAFPPRA